MVTWNSNIKMALANELRDILERFTLPDLEHVGTMQSGGRRIKTWK